MKYVTIITGASGDIGAGISLRLAKEGHSLVLLGNRGADRLQAVAEQCTALGADCITSLGDLSNEAFVDNMIREAIRTFGHIDHLVHAAGCSEVGLLSDLTYAQWTHLVNSNVTSAYLCAKHLTPHLVHNKSGHILFVSSVWGARGASCEAAYSATKGAIDSLTKALAKELAPSGIAVNAVAPGMVNTRMNAAFSEEDIAAICEDIPAGRMTTPEELADLVALLLKAPSYLTGQIIGFNGGWY